MLAGTDTAGEVLARYPGEAGEQLVELTREAFTAGLRWTLRFDAALAFAGLVLSALYVGGRLRRGGNATTTGAPTVGGDPG